MRRATPAGRFQRWGRAQAREKQDELLLEGGERLGQAPGQPDDEYGKVEAKDGLDDEDAVEGRGDLAAALGRLDEGREPEEEGSEAGRALGRSCVAGEGELLDDDAGEFGVLRVVVRCLPPSASVAALLPTRPSFVLSRVARRLASAGSQNFCAAHHTELPDAERNRLRTLQKNNVLRPQAAT